MGTLDTKALRVEAPPADLEDDRIRAVLGARLFGRRDKARVDRFELGERLGSGGMGVVYRASDPTLEREVALKVVRPDRSSAPLRESLLHEARFAARLQHPNVVAVYEVGEHDDVVWIAMELVEGVTLRAWCEAPRTWRDIVEVFIGAGEGLAEAHRRGLVHRDFKPENVLVEALADGGVRPRVADFGVAQPTRVRDDGEDAPFLAAGTPAYMAPEQLVGDRVDPRADQFAFCLALYEALEGKRPFRADQLTTRWGPPRRRSKDRVPRPNGSWPRWLYRIVVRGLEYEPSERFDSMDVLLDALRQGIAQRRRRTLAVALSGAIGAAGLFAWIGAPDPCQGARRSVERVWDASTRQGLQTWIEPEEGAFRQESATALTEGLDVWFTQWGDERESACRASQVERRQSADLRDLRDGCLDRGLLEVDGWLRSVQSSPADPLRISEALEHLGHLPDLRACSDVTTLRRQVPLSGGPNVRAEAKTLRDAVAQLRGATYAGGWEPELARAHLEQAEALGFAPLVADAAFLVGLGELTHGRREQAKAHLGSGYHAAIRGRADRLTAEIALLRAWADIEAQDDLVAGARWLEDAKAFVDALGSPPALHATWLDHAGVLASFDGRHAEAEQKHRRALALRASVVPDSLAVAASRMNLFVALHRQQRYDEARVELGLAREIVVQHLGPHHPQVGKFDTNLASLLQLDGKPQASLEALDRAFEVKRAAFGERHPQLTTTLVNRANTRFSLGDYDGGFEDLREVIAIRTAARGPTHASLLLPLGNLGVSMIEIERFSDALEVAKRMQVVASSHYADDHPDVVLAKHLRALALAGLGQHEDADVLYTQLAMLTSDDSTRACERAEILRNHAKIKHGEEAEALRADAAALRDGDGKACPAAP
jgi:tetratricopeptide (TPR) repeat protein